MCWFIKTGGKTPRYKCWDSFVKLSQKICILFLIFSPLWQDAKKKYDKETEKYCAVLEKHLSLSAKKKEAHLLEVRCRVWV